MTKTALITGVTGQDGSYLAEFLLQKGYEVHGLIRRTALYPQNLKNIENIRNSLFLHFGDLVNEHHLCSIIHEIKPSEIYNLASQSDAVVSFDIPEYTGDVNALGVTRLLEAIRKFSPSSRFYQASSSDLFGTAPAPQNEDTPFHPRSPYAVAKLYAYWIAQNYREVYNMFCLNGILFNHESPRRGENLVTRKITLSIAKILAGEQKTLQLGNLNAKRDWGYAPDYVEAMWLMLQQKEPEDFVIATGKAHTVREFAEMAFKEVGIEIEWRGEGLNEKGVDCNTGKVLVEVSSEYFRLVEAGFLIGDASKARKKLGWKPRVDFKELIRIMVKADLSKVGVKSQ